MIIVFVHFKEKVLRVTVKVYNHFKNAPQRVMGKKGHITYFAVYFRTVYSQPKNYSIERCRRYGQRIENVEKRKSSSFSLFIVATKNRNQQQSVQTTTRCSVEFNVQCSANGMIEKYKMMMSEVSQRVFLEMFQPQREWNKEESRCEPVLNSCIRRIRHMITIVFTMFAFRHTQNVLSFSVI